MTDDQPNEPAMRAAADYVAFRKRDDANIAELEARLDVCHRDIEALMTSADKLEAERDATVAALEQAREALQPFADRAKEVTHFKDHTMVGVPLSSLRRAAAALAALDAISAAAPARDDVAAEREAIPGLDQTVRYYLKGSGSFFHGLSGDEAFDRCLNVVRNEERARASDLMDDVVLTIYRDACHARDERRSSSRTGGAGQ